jgi:hypothetical protein
MSLYIVNYAATCVSLADALCLALSMAYEAYAQSPPPALSLLSASGQRIGMLRLDDDFTVLACQLLVQYPTSPRFIVDDMIPVMRVPPTVLPGDVRARCCQVIEKQTGRAPAAWPLQADLFRRVRARL